MWTISDISIPFPSSLYNTFEALISPLHSHDRHWNLLHIWMHSLLWSPMNSSLCFYMHEKQSGCFPLRLLEKPFTTGSPLSSVQIDTLNIFRILGLFLQSAYQTFYSSCCFLVHYSTNEPYSHKDISILHEYHCVTSMFSVLILFTVILKNDTPMPLLWQEKST